MKIIFPAITVILVTFLFVTCSQNKEKKNNASSLALLVWSVGHSGVSNSGVGNSGTSSSGTSSYSGACNGTAGAWCMNLYGFTGNISGYCSPGTTYQTTACTCSNAIGTCTTLQNGGSQIKMVYYPSTVSAASWQSSCVPSTTVVQATWSSTCVSP